MNWVLVLMLLLLMAGPVSAMRIDADPRTIISFMDRSLLTELDILLVTTDISPENHLVFQVKTKGERTSGQDNDYLLLQILHEKSYVLLIPLSKENGRGNRGGVLIYESDLSTESNLMSTTFKEAEELGSHTGFNGRHVIRGAEFTVPLDWINFGADFSFDAYTVQAKIQGNTMKISEVYDQARKGRAAEKRISAITLLNKICSPKK